MTEAELKALAQSIQAHVAAMSPDEQAAMWAKQRESWVRGMTTLCEHGVLDFEQCGECRAIQSCAHHEEQS